MARAGKLSFAVLALWLGLTGESRAQGKEEADLAQKIAAAQVPVEKLAEPLRSKVSSLLQQPTLYRRGRAEAFPCQPAVYDWLLDHPHHACSAWQSLGAKCATIDKKSDGSFVGVDPLGSELRWVSILTESGRRIWHAEGSIRPAILLPKVTLRALVILNYDEVKGADGRVGIRQRFELFAQVDGKGPSIAKLLGMSTEQVAAKTLDQIGLFFSGMAWYAYAHPLQARSILRSSNPEEAREIDDLLRDSIHRAEGR